MRPTFKKKRIFPNSILTDLMQVKANACTEKDYDQDTDY